MKSKQFKVFRDQEGNEYQFDPKAFQNKMKEVVKMNRSRGKKMTAQQLRLKLAEELNVSEDAIRNWTYGYNGPSDLETIREIAVYFGMEEMELMVGVDQMNSKKTIEYSGLQQDISKNVLRNIYAKMCDVEDMFCAVGFDFSEDDSECKAIDPVLVAIFDLRTYMHENYLDIPKSFQKKYRPFDDKFHEFYTNLWANLDYKKEVAEYAKSHDCDEEHAAWALEEQFVQDYITEMKDLFTDYIPE